MKVIRVNNATARALIEEFTNTYTKPDVIKFVQDGAGNWVTSVECLQAVRFSADRQDVKTFLESRGINNNHKSLKDVLQQYGTQIDYVPLPEGKE